jgi:hypothetical protein
MSEKAATGSKKNVSIRERIVAAINEKRMPNTVILPCAICAHRNWVIGNFIPLPFSIQPDLFNPFGEKIYPLVTVICSNCGNTLFVNIRVLGFSPEEWPSLALDEEPVNV